MLGLFWDSGKENGTDYFIIGYIFGVRVARMRMRETCQQGRENDKSEPNIEPLI